MVVIIKCYAISFSCIVKTMKDPDLKDNTILHSHIVTVSVALPGGTPQTPDCNGRSGLFIEFGAYRDAEFLDEIRFFDV
jgi:hypothetical protein